MEAQPQPPPQEQQQQQQEQPPQPPSQPPAAQTQENGTELLPKEDSAIQSSIKKLKKKFLPGVKYTLLISLIFNFAMLIVGCLSVHKCPVNQQIPLFLIALGAIGIMSKLVSYCRDRIFKYFEVKYLESALYTNETIFFLLGTYWVYKEYKPSYNPLDGRAYCDKTAYLFAFIYITIFYALILAAILGFLFFLFCICFLASKVDYFIKADAEAAMRKEAETNATKKDEEEETTQSLTKPKTAEP